jgi:hypothetical protein
MITFRPLFRTMMWLPNSLRLLAMIVIAGLPNEAGRYTGCPICRLQKIADALSDTHPSVDRRVARDEERVLHAGLRYGAQSYGVLVAVWLLGGVPDDRVSRRARQNVLPSAPTVSKRRSWHVRPGPSRGGVST